MISAGGWCGRIGAAGRGRRNVSHPVWPRAQRATERRGCARRPYRHLTRQSRLRLAQSGAGRGDRGLRMVQAANGAACRSPCRKNRQPRRRSSCSRSSPSLEHELEKVEFFRPPDKRETMQINLRNIFTRMAPTQQDIQTLHGVFMSIAEGRKGPARGGVLDGEEAEMLRALLAEQAPAACRRNAARCGGWRGFCAAIRPRPNACCGTRWSMTAASRAAVSSARRPSVSGSAISSRSRCGS